MPDIPLGAVDTEINRQDKNLCLHGACIRVGEEDNYQDKYILCWEVMSTREKN